MAETKEAGMDECPDPVAVGEGGGRGSGATPMGSGSQATPEAPSDLRRAGFDPSRGPTYRGEGISGERFALGQVLMKAFCEHGAGFDVGRGVFELGVDRVLMARESPVVVDDAPSLQSRLSAAEAARDEAQRLRKEDRAWYEMTVSVVEEQRENYRAARDEAIRERDEARAEVVRLGEQAGRLVSIQQMRNATAQIAESEAARDEACARAERLEKALQEVVLRNRAAWPAETRAERMEQAARAALAAEGKE